MTQITLHNTASRIDEQLEPLHDNVVTVYTCGPTVYNRLHIGNWAAYVYWDTLVRTLRAHNLKVDRVMNITDVGHLVSDADEGEDKLEKGARRENKTAWEVAEFYTADFLDGMKQLNLITPEHVVRATQFIEQQLNLVRTLKQKGFTYQLQDGIYFDTSKFPPYAEFAHLDLEGLKAGARVNYNSDKKQPSDFALWKFTPTGQTRDMQWPTPPDLLDDPNTPVMGFPGWHLECSAMAMTLLGETIDIHTGGIDHIPVHHTNEIAQSEAATGVQFAHIWLHNNHLKVNGTKISKSLDNGYTLQDLEERGFTAMDYRMFVLQGHYRSEGNFTFENLASAQSRLFNWRNVAALRHQTHDTLQTTEGSSLIPSYATSQQLIDIISNDLATPQALAFIDEVFGQIGRTSLDNIHRPALVSLLQTVDELLGLDIIHSTPDISDELKQQILARSHARADKDWHASDEIRDKLLSHGIALRDTDGGTIWEYTPTR